MLKAKQFYCPLSQTSGLLESDINVFFSSNHLDATDIVTITTHTDGTGRLTGALLIYNEHEKTATLPVSRPQT